MDRYGILFKFLRQIWGKKEKFFPARFLYLNIFDEDWKNPIPCIYLL